MPEQNYRRCPTCREWTWMDRHQCARKWDWRYYWATDETDEWIVGEIHATDAEGAAMKAAACYDEEDYPLSRGNDVVIEVRPSGTEEVTKWRASAELEPRYYVTTESP